MATTRNGEVELYYETFGDPARPTLLLINGLGSQCINYAVEWCEMFCAQGFQVVRFDNRDVGPVIQARRGRLRTGRHGRRRHRGAGRDRRRSGARDGLLHGRDDRPAPRDRSRRAPALHDVGDVAHRRARLRRQLRGRPRLLAGTTGLVPIGLHRASARGAARVRVEARMARHRRHPRPRRRRLRPLLLSGRGPPPDAAVAHDGSRADALAAVDLPVLVIHGSRDTLIDPSGGRRTAALIPGARYVEIEGMGHDYPPAVWTTWVTTWAEFARGDAPGGRQPPS